MTDTQPFMDEARKLAFNICPFDEDDEKCAFRAAKWGIIATALSSAYRRGREEERERCAKLCEEIGAEIEVHSLNLPEAMLGRSISSIATAIRTERDKG